MMHPYQGMYIGWIELARIRIYIYIYTLDKGERRCMFSRAVGFIWPVQCMYAFAMYHKLVEHCWWNVCVLGTVKRFHGSLLIAYLRR